MNARTLLAAAALAFAVPTLAEETVTPPAQDQTQTQDQTRQRLRDGSGAGSQAKKGAARGDCDGSMRRDRLRDGTGGGARAGAGGGSGAMRRGGR